MKKYLLPVIINALFYIYVSSVFCLSIKPVIEKGFTGCLFSQIEYPEKQLIKELKSGLPVRIGVNVRLLQGKTIVAKKGIIIIVVYDLWDELFSFKRISTSSVKERQYKQIDLLLTDLNTIKVDKIKQVSETDINTSYSFDGTIVLNPVRKEKIKQIQRLVAETGVSYRASSNTNTSNPEHFNNDGAFVSSGPRFKKMFDKLFEQYTNEDDEIGLWKTSGSSSPFKQGERVVE